MTVAPIPAYSTVRSVWLGAGDEPVDIGREEARELARRELSKPSYDRDEPLTTRIIQWVIEQVNQLIDAAAGTLTSGVGIAVLVAVVLAVAVVVILRAGPMARTSARRPGPVLPEHRLTAADHRGTADAAARAGDWNTASVERFRATVASLGERGVLDNRSGRTADEAAREAGAVLTGVAADLRAGAALFDTIRYGGADADSDDHATMQRIDEAAAAADPRAARTRSEAGLSVPR